MSYLLNKTDGTILTELIDGRIDTDSTNLTLVGRNYNGYGEAFNENFIKLLENFANTAAPSNPLEGQLWWDKSEGRLKIFNGSVWKNSGGPFVQAVRPTMVSGDLWIDNVNKQLYAYDGQELILIGPQYTAFQGKSGFFTETIRDVLERAQTVVEWYIANTLVAVLSNVEFTPSLDYRYADLVTDINTDGTIYKGVNLIDKNNFKFYGSAERTQYLVTPTTNEVRTANSFLPTDRNGITTGYIEVRNSSGLRLATTGGSIIGSQSIQSENYYIENQLNNRDISLRVRSSLYDSAIVNAVYVDSSAGNVGIFTTSRLPLYTLDVAGDMRVEDDLSVEGSVIIDGNLTVKGNTTTIEVETVKVQDKNLELASTETGANGDDLAADGGGIILKSTQGDKEILWEDANDSWNFNQTINLSNVALSYNIADSVKLTTDSLQNIFYADDLVRIGTLENLDVDNVNINGSTITGTVGLTVISNSALNLSASSSINVLNNQRITGVADPVNAQDVATKSYVDAQVDLSQIALTFDVTGIPEVGLYDTLAGYLDDIYPVDSSYDGKIARIHTTSYSATNIDFNDAKDISYIAVDSNGTQNESVVQDIAFNPVGFPSPTRKLVTFQVSSGVWTLTGIPQNYV